MGLLFDQVKFGGYEVSSGIEIGVSVGFLVNLSIRLGLNSAWRMMFFLAVLSYVLYFIGSLAALAVFGLVEGLPTLLIRSVLGVLLGWMLAVAVQTIWKKASGLRP